MSSHGGSRPHSTELLGILFPGPPSQEGRRVVAILRQLLGA
uniref:Uncharacterized protein n=1 Tax=Arundo donax TaxID=35708 RepID=A0A0A9HMH3_ARUDO